MADREAPDDPPQVHRQRGEGRAQGATLRDVLKDLEANYPGITKNVLSDDGGLHRFINVYVNDEDVRYLGLARDRGRRGRHRLDPPRGRRGVTAGLPGGRVPRRRNDR